MNNMTRKFIYINNTLQFIEGYSHAQAISKNLNYDLVIRGFIFEDIKAFYIRINDFSYVYNSLEFKRMEYQFAQNLKACKDYIQELYPCYVIYDSQDILRGKCPGIIEKEILLC